MGYLNSNLIIEIPKWNPAYGGSVSYGYKGLNGERLNNLLYDTTHGYCMYCYSRVAIDCKKFAHAEHAIESFHTKGRQKNKLQNCVPNIGIACPTCNTKFKSKGEKDLNFTSRDIQNFKRSVCKNPKQCYLECNAYKKIKEKYLEERKIILQPMGVSVNGKEYLLQYNLLNLEFEPRSDMGYTKEDIDFINEHIRRFNLNDGKFRTRELLNFCKYSINNELILEKENYNNFMVDLFIDKLLDIEPKQRIRLCNIVLAIGLMKGLI